MDVIGVGVTVSFVALAALGLRLWWQHRSRATVWLTLMFLVLGLARFMGEDIVPWPQGLAVVVGVAVPAILVAFPYLLFRFAETLEPVGRVWRRGALGLTAVTVLGAVIVFSQAQDAGAEPAWHGWYVLFAVGVWTALTAWVVWRFWAAGRRQPIVARRRMWTMAAAAGLLNAALLLAGLGETAAMAAAGEVVAFTSAVTFVLAFAPPRSLREVWRRADERALWQAEGDLVSASTKYEVVAGVLPHVARMLGGDSALFIHRNGEETAVGWDHGGRDAARRGIMAVDRPHGSPVLAEGVAVMQLREGRLGVAANAYTPLFGRDELELMERLGALLDLALSRADLYDRERRARTAADDARARAEAVSAELEALVYGISHDLRTPIVSVRGYVDLLSEDYADRLDDQGRHFIARLQRNTGYMDQLISDLLKLSRTGQVPDEPETVSIADVARQVAEELQGEHPSATFHVGALPGVALGPTRARQLLTNLMTNALAHSGREDVTVRVATQPSERKGMVGFSVTDNGQGVPTAYRDKVFEIFETLGSRPKDEQSGTGIGLAIARRIVEEAGGRIWFADREAGAEVRVELPPLPAT